MEKEFYILEDGLNAVADNLYDLCLTIDTIILGLEHEKIEPQVLACMNSIRQCVKVTCCMAQGALQNQMKEEKEC